MPDPQLFSNLPTLHDILEMVVNDWEEAVSRRESDLADAGESEYMFVRAFADLQPIFLKCLFSYVLFAVSADNAYGVLYKSLDRAADQLRLDVRRENPPQVTALMEKVRRIRNLSIAHFPSDRARPIDRAAAMSWTPMAIGRPTNGDWNLRKLEFRSSRYRRIDEEGNVEESEDFAIQGLDVLHKGTLSYLEAYDQVCCTYLTQFHAGAERIGVLVD